MEERESEMNAREEILSRLRKNTTETFEMPEINIDAIKYDDLVQAYIKASETSGCKVVRVGQGDDLNEIIRREFPDAKRIASNVEGITIATDNPDETVEAKDLNGTDLGILKGETAVAENACVWVPQTMKEKAVMFISEQLVIIVSAANIVNNMHEAYEKIQMSSYGYGSFISGPSKTADIEQALVMGAQAARAVTILLTD